MIAINTLTSIAAPLDISNIDTDQIIPKQFLKRIERTGYGEFLFFDWKRIQEPKAAAHEDESAVMAATGLKPGDPDPTFVLNQPAYAGAKILIAGKNFGCGSSREHAAWALTDFGFLVVIAPSFADIFFSNAGKNGMVLVRLPEADVELLTHRSATNPAHKITISLDAQTINDDQGFSGKFEIDPFRKYCLLNGLDDIGLTLRHAAELDTYESKHNAEFWLAPRGLAS
jgi:3-isopropylmalate/(R)-2-methylmalate dehydratase small subunit